MGTISSGIGLISGLDTQALVSQLLAIEARPRDNLLARMGRIDAQRTALADISARISGILARVNALSNRTGFVVTRAASSSPDVLGVVASAGAPVGSHSFIVRALATTHQLVTRGFSSQDDLVPPGRITLESARARVDRETRLEELRGHAGVQRGSFRVTDAAGKTATVAIHDALTLSEVVQRINDAGVNVTAAIRGDHLELTEKSGGALLVQEVGGGKTAADLGFGPGKTLSTTGQLVGDDLMYLSSATPLGSLNDGTGLRRAKAGGDFRVNGTLVDLSQILKESTRVERLNHGHDLKLGLVRITTVDAADAKQATEVDLTGLKTVGQIKAAIESAVASVGVTLSSNRLVVGYTDTSKAKTLKIEDVSGAGARSLGIDGASESGRITGREVLLVNQLIDVVNAINYADDADGSVTAAIGTHGLTLDAAGGQVVLETVGDSKALEDLGFLAGAVTGPATGQRIVTALNSVLLRSLNGGRSFQGGVISIAAGGGSTTLDLTAATSLRDVVEQIDAAAKSAGLQLEVGIDAGGTRLVVRSLDGLTPVAIADVSGTFAADTGLAAASGAGSASIRSANLQRRYVSEATRLGELNEGRGVALGTIRIIDSKGITRSVVLSDGGVETLRDVISAINASGAGVAARINDTGDGLLVEDTAGGELALRIEDESGTAARDLNIRGESDAGTIDGSYELTFELSGSQSLADVVKQINDRGRLAQASILNDGTGLSPYRISVVSRTTGSAGELLLDADGLDLGLTTLNRAQDARVILGSNPQSGVLITSSSNTLTNVVPGLTLNLTSASEMPVTVNVTEDLEAAVAGLKGLVDAFNAALARIRELTKYDPESQSAGVLLGESAARTAESRLYGLAAAELPAAAGALSRLSQVGVTISEGALLFDEQKFRAALEKDPEAVVAFFTDAERGMAAQLKKGLEQLAGSEGLIKSRDGSLAKQREVLGGRVASINELLERRRVRLLRQFHAMESALARLQAQQGALAQLSALATQFTSTIKR